MGLVFLDQTVNAVQYGRGLLYFINNIASCLRIGLDDLFNPLRVREMFSKCSIVQKVDRVGIGKSLFEPSRFACTPWAENKEAISRRTEEPFSEFFHHCPTKVAQLTPQVNIESQFYPFWVKLQALFWRGGMGKAEDCPLRQGFGAPGKTARPPQPAVHSKLPVLRNSLLWTAGCGGQVAMLRRVERMGKEEGLEGCYLFRLCALGIKA